MSDIECTNHPISISGITCSGNPFFVMWPKVGFSALRVRFCPEAFPQSFQLVRFTYLAQCLYVRQTLIGKVSKARFIIRNKLVRSGGREIKCFSIYVQPACAIDQSSCTYSNWISRTIIAIYSGINSCYVKAMIIKRADLVIRFMYRVHNCIV